MAQFGKMTHSDPNRDNMTLIGFIFCFGLVNVNA